MTVPKIVTQVSFCGECPHYRYYSGGAHECEKVQQIVREKSKVAPFCPLPDFPSRVIAEMQTTIEMLREPYKFGFDLALLTHVATKLKLSIEANGRGILIPYGQGNHAYLGSEYITKIQVVPCEIFFSEKLTKYRLIPDGPEPSLYKALDQEGRRWTLYRLET